MTRVLSCSKRVQKNLVFFLLRFKIYFFNLYTIDLLEKTEVCWFNTKNYIYPILPSELPPPRINLVYSFSNTDFYIVLDPYGIYLFMITIIAEFQFKHLVLRSSKCGLPFFVSSKLTEILQNLYKGIESLPQTLIFNR